MVNATVSHDLLTIEKLREQELEEARIIQSAMLPSHPLHEFDIIISHEFQPIEEVGGDYLDYFPLADGTIGVISETFPEKACPQRFTQHWPWARCAAFTKPDSARGAFFRC